MFVACGIWCLADVSSVSPSSAPYNLIFNLMEMVYIYIYLAITSINFDSSDNN